MVTAVQRLAAAILAIALAGVAPADVCAQDASPNNPDDAGARLKPGECPDGRHMVGGRCLRAPSVPPDSKTEAKPQLKQVPDSATTRSPEAAPR